MSMTLYYKCTGTFGQVWLVSSTAKGQTEPHALKIQSKYELIQDGQVNIMKKFSNGHSFDLLPTS